MRNEPAPYDVPRIFQTEHWRRRALAPQMPSGLGAGRLQTRKKFGILQLVAQDDVRSTGRDLMVDVETVCQ
jgi:hypothetical protein